MNSNRTFLYILAAFFLIAAGVMSFTGYWPGLAEFSVSKTFFNFIMNASGFASLIILALALRSDPNR